MGYSVTLSHIIMVISSICLASVFSAYAFYTGNLVHNELAHNINDYRGMVNLRLEIVYATVDTSAKPHFVIYAKNVGNLPISDYTFLDVYVGEYGKAQLFTYNSTPSSGHFTLTDANSNGVWEPRETATIRAYPINGISGVVFEAKIVPFKGIGSSYLFSAPPA